MKNPLMSLSKILYRTNHKTVIEDAIYNQASPLCEGKIFKHRGITI